MRELTLLILVLAYWAKLSSKQLIFTSVTIDFLIHLKGNTQCGIPVCSPSLSAAWPDDNTTARPTPNQCINIKEPKVETVAVTITETITTDTLTLTTTVTSIETTTLQQLPAYTTTAVPCFGHGCSQGDRSHIHYIICISKYRVGSCLT